MPTPDKDIAIQSILSAHALKGPARGAQETALENASESTGTLARYGVVHRHEPGDPLYSHAPMADGYWTPWHVAQAAIDQWRHLSGEAAKGLALADARCAQLRAALVGLVGVDTRDELEQMEAVMRLMPAPAQDKAATIDAIHALLADEADAPKQEYP